MPARHLILGLDGADLGLVQRLGAQRLPTLHRLMNEGAFAPLASVMPPATLPNWATFLTGVNPGRHRVYDFTTRKGASVQFTAGTVRAEPTIAGRLDALGRACCVVGFPGTWPPEPLDHGVFISGWDSPVAFEADTSFVHPDWLHRDIKDRFGGFRFDDVDEFAAGDPDWHRNLPDALIRRIDRKVALSEWLLRQRSWDLAAFYFGESDTAAHHLWSLFDPGSPRYTPSNHADGLARVYEALDNGVSALLQVASEAPRSKHVVFSQESETNVKNSPVTPEVTLVSDHGFGGASDKVLYLNRALADAGLLQFKKGGPPGAATALTSWMKDQALTRLPPKVRERLFRARGTLLPSLVESQTRFGAIDFANTTAFSDELNYFPAVHLNLRGREPQGVVSEGQREEVILKVQRALLDLRDPWTHAPVVHQVMRREELFEGPYVNEAPDLLLDFALDQGYSYNLQPSASAPEGTGPFRRLSPDEYLGRKGRSLPGSHRAHGLFIAHGPSVEPVGQIDAAMADATATVLARMGVGNVPDASGRVLFELLAEANPGAGTEALARLGSRPPQQDARKKAPKGGFLEKRLRALGYVDW